MKRLISTACAAAVLAGAMFLPALLRAEDKKDDKPAAHEHEHMRGGHEGRWGDKLGITDEQKGKLKTLKRAHREAEETAKSEMGATMRKLSDQLEDKASDKDLAATLDKLRSGHKAMQAEREKFMDSMSSILTPSQRARMAVAMLGHMRGGPGMMHGRGGRGERFGRGKPGEEGMRHREWNGGGDKGGAPEKEDDDE